MGTAFGAQRGSYHLALRFGALVPSLAEQLNRPPSEVELWQEHADAITRLMLHGLITEASARSARKKLLKVIGQGGDVASCSLTSSYGATFDSGIPLSPADQRALGQQLIRVRDVLLDGQVHTVAEIAARTGDPENSVSANCRNLRKSKHGGYDIRLIPLGSRRFGYRLVRA